VQSQGSQRVRGYFTAKTGELREISSRPDAGVDRLITSGGSERASRSMFAIPLAKRYGENDAGLPLSGNKRDYLMSGDYNWDLNPIPVLLLERTG
jgi:hypothetical protein